MEYAAPTSVPLPKDGSSLCAPGKSLVAWERSNGSGREIACGTQWVIKPTRQRLATSRKRVLRRSGQP
jgi:hypothetical protein